MKPRLFILLPAFCLLFSAPLAAYAQTGSTRVSACKANQLSFTTDNENGTFNGMSHSGTLLVLRNLGPNACSVPGRPVVVFEDANHQVLPSSLRTPVGMHPGPVILPVVIPAGAEVTSRMRWVSSDAYDAGNGISPAWITLRIAGGALIQKFSGQLFGAAGTHPEYSLSLFERDPSYSQPCEGKSKTAPQNSSAGAPLFW